MNGVKIIQSYINSSFATHDDCKGHTGAIMTLGKGVLLATSFKLKINARSSTESELIDWDAMFPEMLWMRYFLEAQSTKLNRTLFIKIMPVS